MNNESDTQSDESSMLDRQASARERGGSYSDRTDLYLMLPLPPISLRLQSYSSSSLARIVDGQPPGAGLLN